MITVDGQRHIKNYLAGMAPSIARAIALGVGSGAESPTSTALDFEVTRADIHLISYDFVTNEVLFKASVPTSFIGIVHEVAIYSVGSNPLSGAYGSKPLTTFSQDEGWTGAFSSTDSRIGGDGVLLSPAAGLTASTTRTGISLDLSGYSNSDKVAFALNAANSFVAGVALHLKTDASNYYSFTWGAQTSGYKVLTATKGSATVTGTPVWSNITEIQVVATVGAQAGAALLDGIRMEDVDTLNPEYVMVAREVLATPYNKKETAATDIEFRLPVTIT